MATINSASYIRGTDTTEIVAPKLAQLQAAGSHSIADLVNQIALNTFVGFQIGQTFNMTLSDRQITIHKADGSKEVKNITDVALAAQIAQVIERIRNVATQVLPQAQAGGPAVAAAQTPVAQPPPDHVRELADLRGRVTQLVDAFARADERVRTLDTDVARQRADLDRKDAELATARQAGLDVARLQAEAAGLRANLTQTAADRDAARTAQEQLNASLDGLRQQNAVLERNAATLQERTAQQAQELIRVQATVQSQQARLQELERLNASANRELDQARETIRAKEAEIARTADDAAELPQLRRDLESFRADLAAKEGTLAQAQRDAAGLTDQLATLRREQDAHVTGLRAEFAQERIRLETQRKELERDNTRLANEAGALRGTADTQHTEIAALQQNVDARQAEIRGLHERMEALQRENGRLSERSEQLQATLERATAQSAANQAAAAELATLQSQYVQDKAVYERSLAHYKTELAELQKLI